MAVFTNFTGYAVGEVLGIDPEAAEFYALIVKATFTWNDDGEVAPAAEQPPIVETDQYVGEPGLTGPVYETDCAPFKPRLDVLVTGSIALPTAVEQVEVTLEVGDRIRKSARVLGDRVWVPGVVKTLGLTKPRPFQRMPLEWDRAFGGTDPDDPQCTERRNPVGRGMRKKAKSLEGQLAPNFEDPRKPIESWDDRPTPIGFGPIGRNWEPRIQLAGTYDKAWEEDRFPLAPLDFDPGYHNCAPPDQQLDAYRPGEEVRLRYMTPRGHERFRLPPFEVPVQLEGADGDLTRELVRPDTIVIEPSERRFSLIGRICHFPVPNVLALGLVLVGQPSRGFQIALETGKEYLQPHNLKPWGID